MATKKMTNNNTINISIDVHILTSQRFSVTHCNNSQVSDSFFDTKTVFFLQERLVGWQSV